MNHKESILEAFRANGGKLTLGEILNHPWGYEFRARATELRHEGYIINLIKEDHKMRSNNLYELIEPISPPKIFYEGKQAVFPLGV